MTAALRTPFSHAPLQNCYNELFAKAEECIQAGTHWVGEVRDSSLFGGSISFHRFKVTTATPQSAPPHRPM